MHAPFLLWGGLLVILGFITYLAGMTANVDQKIGRDAIERYEVLKKELETIRAEVDQLLGPATTTNGAPSTP